jgi:hypothetical protein
VDQVQVDLVDAQAPEAARGLGDGIFAPQVELGGDEDVLARHAAVAQPLAHALLVAVGLGGVDMAVPGLERPPHGVHAFRPARTCDTPRPSIGSSFPSARMRARPSGVTAPAVMMAAP